MDQAPDLPSARLGGEWVGKLERFRHENHLKREEKKEGGGGHEERRQRRWLGGGGGKAWRGRRPEEVPTVRVQRDLQEEEEEEEEEEQAAAAAADITPLGASFMKVGESVERRGPR